MWRQEEHSLLAHRWTDFRFWTSAVPQLPAITALTLPAAPMPHAPPVPVTPDERATTLSDAASLVSAADSVSKTHLHVGDMDPEGLGGKNGLGFDEIWLDVVRAHRSAICTLS